LQVRALGLIGAAAASVWLACQGGVLTDKGNAFPCDFSQREGVRDQVCAPGDVCGVDNLCRGFHYEGPQFEAQPDGAPLPDFSSVTQLHPGVLNQPVVAVTRRGDRSVDQGVALLATPAGLQGVVLTLGADTLLSVVTFDVGLDAPLSLAQPGDWIAAVVAQGANSRTYVGTSSALGPNSTVVRDGVAPVIQGERLRTGNDVAVLLGGDLNSSIAGELKMNGSFQSLDVAGAKLDGGTFSVLEARYVPSTFGAGQDLLMLGDDGFLLRRPLVGITRVTAPDVEMPSLPRPSRPTLRQDVTGAIWAFTRGSLPGWRALSTWRLDRNSPPSMARLWSDCSPCGAGRILAFVPVLNGAPEVQVVCATGDVGAETLSLTRVTGSAAIDESEECLLEPASPPFSLAKLNVIPSPFATGPSGGGVVQDDANGEGILLGGREGQLWSGTSLTSALPVFLERTPVAFGTFEAPDGGVLPVALTDRYLAVPLTSSLGFEVLDVHRATSVPLGEDVVVAAMMGQAPGWGILSSGDVSFFGRADGGLQFGPRLVDGRGAPALSPFFGEGAHNLDDDLVSFVMVANDSLYFTPVPTTLTATQDTLPEVTPQLTPAPGSPIRSMTLERSAIGTDGVSRVRGYLIAGRQLFLFTLSGGPPRWSATPIILQGGEPVEVWMDNPLGGLGRVGYRDGEVFTLPGGFSLVSALPRGDGGVPVQVLDYENLGGWPVAMTSIGLFVAQWPKVGVHLQNRFPDGGEGKAMDWSEVTLPDGGRPWLGKNARLQVVRTGVPNVEQVYRLLVYTDDAVLEVGTLTRK
jgi:hypothetical protein